MGNRGNIVYEPVWIYLAEQGTPDSDLSQWLNLGYCDGGKTRLTVARRFIRVMNGYDLLLGKEFVFSAVGLETNYAKVQALEILELEKVDILLIDYYDYWIRHHLKGYKLDISPEWPYSPRDARSIEIKAVRRVARNRFLTAFELKTLIAYDNWATVNVS